MLPTTTARGIDRALHAQRLGGPYQRRLDRHALGPPVHGQHGRREPRVDAVGAAQQERAAAAPEHARRRNVSRKISCEPMRQGDQMYIMMEWISAADPALRVVALPDEYYCYVSNLQQEGRQRTCTSMATMATMATPKFRP